MDVPRAEAVLSIMCPRPRILLLVLLSTVSCDRITNPEARCGAFASGVAGSSLEGRVHDRNGVPAANAAITLGLNRQTVTDGDGRFLFNDLSAGAQPIAYAGAPVSGEVTIARGRNVVDIVVAGPGAEGWLVGRVLDACDGHPIAGATIGGASTQTTSAADGTFAFFACCNSAFDQKVSKPGYESVPFSEARVFGRTIVRDFLLQRE